MFNTSVQHICLRNLYARHYREIVVVLQKLLDLMTGLRKVKGNIPSGKETVVSVFKERREFVRDAISTSVHVSL